MNIILCKTIIRIELRMRIRKYAESAWKVEDGIHNCTSRSKFVSGLFGSARAAVIGMVHVQALPGTC